MRCPIELPPGLSVETAEVKEEPEFGLCLATKWLVDGQPPVFTTAILNGADPATPLQWHDTVRAVLAFAAGRAAL